jgi:hypothetical protein
MKRPRDYSAARRPALLGSMHAPAVGSIFAGLQRFSGLNADAEEGSSADGVDGLPGGRGVADALAQLRDAGRLAHGEGAEVVNQERVGHPCQCRKGAEPGHALESGQSFDLTCSSPSSASSS